MVWYKKRTIIGNTRCLKLLYSFRDDLIYYFNNIEPEAFGSVRENTEARSIRTKINRSIHEVHDIITSSGVSTNLRYTPPAMVGGYIQNIDLVTNVFNLSRYMIEPNNLIDFVDRSIGIYESDRNQSIFRTINPFFWFGRLLDFIVRIPFSLFLKAGINTKQFEDSIWGKLSKLVLYIATLTASILTILQIMGYSDSFKRYLELIYTK